MDISRLRRYRVSYGKDSYEVRVLTRGEIVKLTSKYTDIAEFHDAVCRLCVMDADCERLMAGRVTSLALFILDKSGFLKEEGNQVALDADKWQESIEGKMEILAMAYLGCSLEYLWNCDTAEWYRIAKAAQYAAVYLHNVNLAAYLDPETAMKEAKKAAAAANVRNRQAQGGRDTGYRQKYVENEQGFSWSK